MLFLNVIKSRPFIVAGFVIMAVIILPITLIYFRNQQTIKSRADKTVIVSFEPTSNTSAPLQIPAGSIFSLDVFVDPGGSEVSYVKTEIVYDTAKFAPAGGFIPNQEAFSQLIESVDAPGKVTATLSVGSDTSKVIKAKTKLGTLTLKAASTVSTNDTGSVTFGPNTQALAVSANASFGENVIANTLPAEIKFNQPSNSCGTSPSDTMLVIDTSGSMNDKAGTTGTKLSNAKIAANQFIDILAKETRNYFGLASFASTASLKSPLTTSAATVKNQVNALIGNNYTCIECGIKKANLEITAKKRAGIKNVVVLLTDGRANYIEGSSRMVAEEIAETQALNAAITGYNTNGTTFYVIGLGNDVNSAFLTKLAETTGGNYYFSPTTDQLNAIYSQISVIIAKGSVSGIVFNDTNANSTKDPDEETLPGAILQLFSASQSAQMVTTDSTGNYNIPNLCDDTYTLKQLLHSGWKQTYPVNPPDYTFKITNGYAITNKNFGNNKGARCSDTIDNDGNGFTDGKDATCHTDGDPDNPNSYDPKKDGERGVNTCSDSIDNNDNGKIDGADPICHTDGDPTKPWNPDLPESLIPTATPSPTNTPTPEPTVVPTIAPTDVPEPGAASFTMDIILHGIGAGGDNANPSGNSMSNKNPIHPVQPASVKIYDVSNQLFASATGEVTYSSASGNYKGTIQANKAVPAGPYNIRVTVERHLTKQVPGIQTISSNSVVQVPLIAVVAGDITSDNRLDIRDYNMLLNCYSDIAPALSCDDPAKKISADITDDGNVNQFDYNLFLRELSTQPGE